MAGASLLAFIPLVALHNLLEGLAGVASAGAVQAVLQAGGVAAFLLAVMVCAAGIVVGLVGSAAMLVRGRRKPVPRLGTG